MRESVAECPALSLQEGAEDVGEILGVWGQSCENSPHLQLYFIQAPMPVLLLFLIPLKLLLFKCRFLAFPPGRRSGKFFPLRWCRREQNAPFSRSHPPSQPGPCAPPPTAQGPYGATREGDGATPGQGAPFYPRPKTQGPLCYRAAAL